MHSKLALVIHKDLVLNLIFSNWYLKIDQPKDLWRLTRPGWLVMSTEREGMYEKIKVTFLILTEKNYNHHYSHASVIFLFYSYFILHVGATIGVMNKDWKIDFLSSWNPRETKHMPLMPISNNWRLLSHDKLFNQ